MREYRFSDDGFRALRTRSAALMTRYAGLIALFPGLAALGLIFLSNDVLWVWVGTALLAGLDLFLYIQQRGKPGVSPIQTYGLLVACLIALLAGAVRAALLGAFK